MSKLRFTESRIVAILEEAELDTKVHEPCRKHGTSDAQPRPASPLNSCRAMLRFPPRRCGNAWNSNALRIEVYASD